MVKRVLVSLCLLLFVAAVSAVTAKAYDGNTYAGQAFQQFEYIIIILVTYARYFCFFGHS